MRDKWNFGQQKRGWTRRPLNRDRYPSAAAGYTRLCCSSGDPRRARRISGREILPDPSPKRSIRAGVTDVRLSCVAYREPLRTHAKPAGRYYALAEGWYSLSRALKVAGAQLAGFSPLRLPAHASTDTQARGPEPCKCSPHKGEVNADELCLQQRTSSRSSPSLCGDSRSFRTH